MKEVMKRIGEEKATKLTMRKRQKIKSGCSAGRWLLMLLAAGSSHEKVIRL